MIDRRKKNISLFTRHSPRTKTKDFDPHHFLHPQKPHRTLKDTFIKIDRTSNKYRQNNSFYNPILWQSNKIQIQRLKHFFSSFISIFTFVTVLSIIQIKDSLNSYPSDILHFSFILWNILLHFTNSITFSQYLHIDMKSFSFNLMKSFSDDWNTNLIEVEKHVRQPSFLFFRRVEEKQNLFLPFLFSIKTMKTRKTRHMFLLQRRKTM